MARLSVSLFGVVVMVVALGVSGQGAVAAPTLPQDFVAIGFAESTIPGRPSLHNISINATSDPLGGDPSGGVAFGIDVVIDGRPTIARIEGPVTCLAVHGNRAVIGARTFQIGPILIAVVDNGSTGSPADEFGWTLPGPLPTDCSDESRVAPFPLSSGDIVVRDAPTKAQCLNGGWRNYTDATGQPFGNQGQCIAVALGVA